tara:strand:+ start:252 stop:410 length:159 start_codon:yes stop_codon:yes gene_type:complete
LVNAQFLLLSKGRSADEEKAEQLKDKIMVGLALIDLPINKSMGIRETACCKT